MCLVVSSYYPSNRSKKKNKKINSYSSRRAVGENRFAFAVKTMEEFVLFAGKVHKKAKLINSVYRRVEIYFFEELRVYLYGDVPVCIPIQMPLCPSTCRDLVVKLQGSQQAKTHPPPTALKMYLAPMLITLNKKRENRRTIISSHGRRGDLSI